MSESWQEFAKRQSDYAAKMERERDEARRERDALEMSLAKKAESYRASVLAAEAETKQWKEFFYAERHRAERAERDAERLEWLQRNAVDITCVDPESDASAWAIKYLNPADLEGPELIAGGSTLAEAVDAAVRALDAEAQP